MIQKKINEGKSNDKNMKRTLLPKHVLRLKKIFGTKKTTCETSRVYRRGVRETVLFWGWIKLFINLESMIINSVLPRDKTISNLITEARFICHTDSVSPLHSIAVIGHFQSGLLCWDLVIWSERLMNIAESRALRQKYFNASQSADWQMISSPCGCSFKSPSFVWVFHVTHS